MVVPQEVKGGYSQGRSYEQPWLRAAYEGPCHQWTCERSAWYGPLLMKCWEAVWGVGVTGGRMSSAPEEMVVV